MPKDIQQPDETSHPIMVDQAIASSAQSGFSIVDDGHGSVKLFVDLSNSKPTQSECRPVGIKASIPLFYLQLPPMPKLPLPAIFPSEPGLVRLLATYPGNLLSTAEVPAELADRLANEVVDHLDCARHIEVALADVNEDWLGSFRQYLDTFYQSERVEHYVETIRFLVARYRAALPSEQS